MDIVLENLICSLPVGFIGIILLIAILLIALLILGKGADILVDEAVALSRRFGVPKMIIGATIVSLGTTLPEVTVSVVSALKGASGLAMGNAVGSIICDTGLILGVAALIRPLPFNKKQVSFQGWCQLGSGVLLVVISTISALIFPNMAQVASGKIASDSSSFIGGVMPQIAGFALLFLLVLYIIITIKSAKNEEQSTDKQGQSSNALMIIIKMIAGMIIVILSSKLLIPTAQELAIRCHIPETVVAATLVAFGTSLPELVTGITASKKGHGDLAIGNVLGADILNALLVVGASSAVTPKGLFVDMNFYTMLFPAMLFVLIVFRFSVICSRDTLKRPVGFVLLLAYSIVTVAGYVFAK